jgi:hypothetical protein
MEPVVNRTITPEGEPLKWTAVYWRHYVDYRAEFDTFEAAAGFMQAGSDAGDLAEEAILRPDGSPVPRPWYPGDFDEEPTAQDRPPPGAVIEILLPAAVTLGPGDSLTVTTQITVS